MEKYLIYSHPAVAPISISADKWYTLEYLQTIFTMEEIKCFFTPCDFDWEDIELIKISKNK